MEQQDGRPIHHVAALDGLRGVAVAAILLADAHHLTASSPALDLGFVLSGFLVTARLLAEHRATGSISIGRWFGRRARRLLPALFLLLVGAVLSEPVWGSAIGRHDLRGDAFAALAGVSNWRTIAAGRPGTISPAASPLEHLWSLAVMAQFLLVWPLATIGVTRRRPPAQAARRLLATATAAAAGSAAVGAALVARGAPTIRLVEGTDTRAFGLLVGAATACWWAEARGSTPAGNRAARAVVAVAGPAAAAALVGIGLAIHGASPLRTSVALHAASVLAAVVIVGSMLPGGLPLVGPVLRTRPLRCAGRIAYGLYLWHWPVFLVLTEARTGRHGAELLAARIAASVALAAASYLLVERRILAGAVRSTTAPAAIVASVGVIALLATLVTADAGRDPGAPVAASPRPPTQGTDRRPRVLYLGDSVAMSLAEHPIADPVGFGIDAVDGGVIGCGIVYEGHETKGLAGDVTRPPSCTTGWPALVAEDRPDAVVVDFGAPPLTLVQIDGAFRDSCSPEYRAMFRDRLADQVAVLGRTGARVILVTNPHNDHPLRPADTDALQACANAVVQEVADAGPADLIDLAGHLCPAGTCTDELDGQPVRPDSIHFNGPGGALVARWVADQIRAALAAG